MTKRFSARLMVILGLLTATAAVTSTGASAFQFTQNQSGNYLNYKYNPAVGAFVTCGTGTGRQLRVNAGSAMGWWTAVGASTAFLAQTDSIQHWETLSNGTTAWVTRIVTPEQDLWAYATTLSNFHSDPIVTLPYAGYWRVWALQNFQVNGLQPVGNIGPDNFLKGADSWIAGSGDYTGPNSYNGNFCYFAK